MLRAFSKKSCRDNRPNNHEDVHGGRSSAGTCEMHANYGPLKNGKTSAVQQPPYRDHNDWESLLGKPVCISGVKEGILRYYGRTKFADGLWCGVDLTEPVGKNDGTVNGVRYFHCKPNHGIFAPETKVSPLSSHQIHQREQLDNDESNQSCYTRKEMLVQDARVAFLKQSASDPAFQDRTAGQQHLVSRYGNDTFSDNNRLLNEQREAPGINGNEQNFRCSGHIDPRQFDERRKHYPAETGYSRDVPQPAKPQDLVNFPRKVMSEYALSNLTKSALAQSHSCPHSTLNLKGTGIEALARRSSTSRPSRVFPELDIQQVPDPKTAFVSPEFFDFQWDNDDDPASLDFDESLGILTPSQMKDFTFCNDLQTSVSDTRAFDFPSSESFDDVNDLPEDEQVHDVAIHYASSNIKSSSEMSHKSQCDAILLPPQNNMMSDSKSSSVSSKFSRSSASNFLRSITTNNVLGFRRDLYSEFAKAQEYVSASNQVSFTTLNKTNSQGTAGVEAFVNSSQNHQNIVNQQSSMSSASPQFDRTVCTNIADDAKPSESEVGNFVSSHQQEEFSSSKVPRKGDTVSSLQGDLESLVASKEKLSVSWDDCVAGDQDQYAKVERPESVYTVGSSDTGFQEDGEFDVDLGMTTSMESEEGKRFSMISRDSVLAGEVDIDKVLAESNSTSGYSTGLSDSCCNDRPEDEGSRRHMEDSFQDVADYAEENCVVPMCAQDSTFPKETTQSGEPSGFFDTANHQDLDSTFKLHITESSTILSLDSTADTVINTSTDNANDSEKSQESPENCTVIQDDNETMDLEMSNRDIKPNMRNRTSTPQQENMSKSNNVSNSRSPTTPKIINVNKSDSNVNKTVNDLKSPRSPKRNVMSKIKTVIGGYTGRTSPKSKQETGQSGKKFSSAPKKSRWDAVTSKIAASLAEEKTKPKAKRDIKGKVDTNLTSARQSCMSPNLSICSDKKLDSVASSNSSKSRRTMDRRNQIHSQINSKSPLEISGTRNQRPVKNCSTSRSTSPAAPSESSSASSTSHPSRNKIPQWKGSNSTVASSIPQFQKKKITANAKPPLSQTSRIQNKDSPRARLAKNAEKRLHNENTFLSSTVCKSQNVRIKSAKEQTGGTKPLIPPRPVRPPMWLSKAELSQEIQHLSTLCESRTKELNKLKLDTKHVATGFDALAVVIRYLSTDLQAFQNSKLAADLKEAQEKLNQGRMTLSTYETEVSKLKTEHSKEIEQMSETLNIQYEERVKDMTFRQKLEVKGLKEHQEKELSILKEELKSSCEEERLQLERIVDDLKQELRKQREELEIFHQHELDDLEERMLEKQQNIQAELEKVQKQYDDMKFSAQTMEEALNRDTDSKLQWISSKKGDLQNEVDSLKAVLEIKNNELHALRKENLEMQKELEELPLAREKIKMLQARAEDLKALMVEKVQIERRLSTEHQSMKEIFHKETKVNERLSMENEELQWKLKQALEASLLATSIPDENEFGASDSFVFDSLSQIDIAPEDVLSPIKSPRPSSSASSRTSFFTYMNQEEMKSMSPQSPRNYYKRIQSSPNASTGSVKLFGTPRKTRGNQENSSQSHEGTPCKVAKHISSNSADNLSKRHRASSVEGRVLSTNVVNAPSDGSCIAEDSSFGSSDGSPNLAAVQCEDNIQFQSGTLESNQGWPSSEEGTEDLKKESAMEEDQSDEVIDPKTFYHMAFPVFKDSKTGGTMNNEDGKSAESSPNDNECDTKSPSQEN